MTTTLPPSAAVATTKATTTTRPPASTAAPTTSAAPSTTTTTTTTRAPADPVAVGTAVDPQVAFVAEGATRYFYAGTDAAASTRDNVGGAAQALYYDVYEPRVTANGTTVLYLHSGAFNLGYANTTEAVTACRQLAQLGSWCVSVEYRRGFAGFASLDGAAVDVTPAEAARYPQAVALARQDVLDAWAHLDAAARELRMPRRYLLIGEGSGAILAADLALVEAAPYDVAGLMLTAGSPSSNLPLTAAPDFPVVIHAGLFDPHHPAYNAPALYDADLPTATGFIDMYEQIADSGAAVRLYLRAQQGDFNGTDRIADYAAAVSLFLAGGPSGVTAAAEYQFVCEDPAFGAAGPGVRINTARFPQFRYEPYQSDLEAGLTPALALALHPLEGAGCPV